MAKKTFLIDIAYCENVVLLQNKNHNNMTVHYTRKKESIDQQTTFEVTADMVLPGMAAPNARPMETEQEELQALPGETADALPKMEPAPQRETRNTRFWSAKRLAIAIMVLIGLLVVGLLAGCSGCSEEDLTWDTVVAEVPFDSSECSPIRLDMELIDGQIAGIEDGRFDYPFWGGCFSDSLLSLKDGFLILGDLYSGKTDTLKGIQIRQNETDPDFTIDPKGRFILIYDRQEHGDWGMICDLYRIQLKKGKLSFCKMGRLLYDDENFERTMGRIPTTKDERIVLPLYEASGSITRIREVTLTCDQLADITPEELKKAKTQQTRYL